MPAAFAYISRSQPCDQITDIIILMKHLLLKPLILISAIAVIFTAGCSAQTEEQALRSLREMTRDGKLPPEAQVAAIESKFAGKKTGSLAKLLRAWIKFQNKDYAGAAGLLDTNVFEKTTRVADHAMFLRGRALQGAGDNASAGQVFATLIERYPNFVDLRDARIAWANSAVMSGNALEVPARLVDLSSANDRDAVYWTAKAYEIQNSQAEAVKYYRRALMLYGANDPTGKEITAKLQSLGQPITPQSADENMIAADTLFNAKKYAEAAVAYGSLAAAFPSAMTADARLRQITSLAQSGRSSDAQTLASAMPTSAAEREDAFRQVVLGYARSKAWPQLRSSVDLMRAAFPNGKLVPKTLMDAGFAARDGRNRTDESYYFNTAVVSYPNAVEVASAQFETAWVQHESGNFTLSSQMMIDHLAKYANKDTTNRGKAGYWSARDAERAGNIANACALYDGTAYRYSANWYGYLAVQRLNALRARGECRSTTPTDAKVAQAVSNLKTVTVAKETADASARDRIERSDELSTAGLFDWAIDELNEAKKTAANSPTVNLALARHYRMKSDNVNALLALAKSYPDYAQMFPEEMGREEWDIFYPLIEWGQISSWSKDRGLDPYNVAGLIRQESVFNPRARSGANAYGLMQLLLPTAQSTARKWKATFVPTSGTDLFQPAINIELGTAYMKDQLAKYGRLEYLAVAYNAGPGRVAPWRASLPAEMDEFVEEIPFKETKAYVQGVIRNSAQYRRLYDDNGQFRSIVGTRQLRGEIDSKPQDQFTADNPEINLDGDSDGE